MNQRQCHSQGRRQAVSIVLLGLLTLSSGCIDVRTRLIKTETIEHVSGRFPDGPPTVSIQPHPDNLGWAVSLQQPARIETAQSKQELWEYTQYQFMPPSMIVGVVQCPIVTGLWVVTLGTFGGDSIRDACMRVLMFEPHAKGEQLGVAQPTGVRTEPTSLPVSDGAIRLRWLQEKGPEVSTPLGSDGTAQVRLHRLTDQLSRTDLAQQALLDQSAEGIIIHGTETLTTWPITPGQLRTARQQLPATSLPGNSWPQTIRVTVEEPTGGTRESRLQWKTWLQEYFERRRLVANPAEAALDNVQDEKGNRETVRTKIRRVPRQHATPGRRSS
jgi:hypothetical protein